jgi:hypothetical protein
MHSVDTTAIAVEGVRCCRTDLEAASAAGEEERGQVRVAVDGRDVCAGEHEGLDDVQHAPHHAAVALARAYPPREKM